MSTPRLVLAVAIAWAGALSIPGCAGAPERAAGDAMTPERAAALLLTTDDAYARLESLAERERTRPARPINAPALAARLGLPELTPADDGQRARAALESARAGLTGSAPPAASERAALDMTTAEDRETAAYLLAAAKEDAGAGKTQAALDALDRAAELDPANPAIPLARMRTQLDARRRTDAVAAARRAIQTPTPDADAVLLVALESQPADVTDAALARLVGALEQPGSLGVDTRPLASIAAGEALIERGWLRAGAQTILEGLGTLPEPSADSPWRTDLVRALGRADSLRQRAGDALVRAGDFENALDAYRSGQTDASGPRIQYTLVRTGRPAAAAIDVIRGLREHRSPPTPEDLAVLEVAGGRPELARPIAAAMVSLRDGASGGGPTLRGELTRAAAIVLGGADGADLLRAHLITDAPDADVASDLLALAPSPRARVDEAVALVRARPEHARRWGAALLGGDAPPARLTQEIDGRRGWDAALLGAGVDLQLRLPRRAIGRLESIDEPDAPRAPIDALVVEAGAEAGRWDIADAALGRLAADTTADPVLRLTALRAAQRLSEAYELAEAVVTERDPEIESLLIASELALQRSEPRDAELFLQTASELDPHEDRVYAALLTLYAPGGPLVDESQVTRVRRLLRENRPAGVLTRLYDARDLAEGGLLDEAERRLRELVAHHPDEPGAYELLLGVWGQAAASGAHEPDEVYEEAANWLEGLLATRPGSPPIGASLARVLITLGRPEEAMQTLLGVETSVGAPVLSVMRERITANDLGDEAGARELSMQRLDHPTLSIDDSLARAALEIEAGDAAKAHETLTAGLPERAELTPDQGARLARVAAIAVASLNPRQWAQEDYATNAGPTVAIIDLAIARGAALSNAIRDARLSLSALDPAATPEVLAQLAMGGEDPDPAVVSNAFRRIAQGLLAADRVNDAIALCVIGATRDAGFDAQLLTDAVTIAGQLGAPEATRALIGRLASSGRSLDAAPTVWDDAPPEGANAEGVHAELAYQIASIASFVERDDVAEAVYRIALEHDPGHAWSNNDLGYMLADTDRDLEEAERLIEIAYEQMPESANVADSLGWVRYKLGQFEDSGDREGAIALLGRALTLDDGSSNATVHDHLGDALWRAGRREDAEQSWLDAEEAVRTQARAIRRQGVSDNPATRRYEARRMSIRKKLLAIQAGEQPPVAPIADPPPDK